MKHLWLIFAIVLVWLAGCSKGGFSEVKPPEPRVIYDFPQKTKLDGGALPCTYDKNYRWRESASDGLKQLVRDHFTGRISVKEQAAIGKTFHENHLPCPLTSHPRLAKAKEIVAKMKPFLASSAFQHEVFALSSSAPNACTLAGGSIYLTTGLLDEIPSDDALAYVLGHELGHNENGHTEEGARIITQVEKWKKEMSAGGNIFTAVKVYTLYQTYSIAATCFDQTDELEADLCGLYLAHMAGYDPEKALQGIEKLRDWEGPPPEGEFKKFLESLRRSHPWADDRYTCAKSNIVKSKRTLRCETVFPESQRAIVDTQKDSLLVREYPNSPKILGKAAKGEEVKMVCNCDYEDVVNGKKGRWIYIQTPRGEIGWSWGGFLKSKG